MHSFHPTREYYLQLAEEHDTEIIERKTCIYSGQQFPIYAREVSILEKLSPKIDGITYALPTPVVAPHIRRLLRTVWKNERTLYYHTCDLTGKKSISRINPSLGVQIYTNEAWASDAWETTDYGQERDTGSVTDKIKSLAWTVPYQDLIGSLTNTQTNALYTNYTADITDSYLVFGAHTIQNCYYLTKARRCTDCVDCVKVDDCNRCVGCYDSKACHGCVGLTRCSSCVMSRYLIDCVSCQECIGCVGLEHKQYCVYNQQLTKEDYHRFKEGFMDAGAQLDTEQWEALVRDHTPPRTISSSENATGESVYSCMNILSGKDLFNCQDMLWCDGMSQSQDCLDVSSYGHESSRMAHCSQVGRYSNSLLGCVSIGRSEHLLYCIDVKKSRYCFGCVNMKAKEYCIFNTQYTKEEYFEIVPQLIARMQTDGSRGHFLDPATNVIIYNDSKVLEEFPVKQIFGKDGEVLFSSDEGYGTVRLGDLLSQDVSHAVIDFGGEQAVDILRRTKPIESSQSDTAIDAIALPVMSNDIAYEQLNRPIRCQETGRLYRINKAELDIYQSLGCGLPRVHHDVRYEQLIANT